MNKIPKNIYLIFISDDEKEMDELMINNIENTKKLNPEYKINLFNKNDCIKFIKQNYSIRELNAFYKLNSYAYRSDLVRYLLLYKFGGIYMDIRMVCKYSFDKIFNKNTEFFVCKDCYKDCITNGFIISIKQHIFLKKTIDNVLFNIENNIYGPDALYPTGPRIFGKCIDLKNINEFTYIGQHKSSKKGNFLYNHNKLKFIRTKYKKNNNTEFKGGEWKNNYNDFYYSRNVYKL